MNNVVLQKLLHAYQAMKHNPKLFVDNFTYPSHFDVEKIPQSTYYNHLKFISHEIQQSVKFYLPVGHQDNELTDDELLKLTPDLEYFLPFQNTYLQVDFVDPADGAKRIIMLLLHHNEGEKDDEGSDMFHAFLNVYDLETKLFLIDPTPFVYSFRDDENYTFWINYAYETHEGVDTTADHGSDIYSNPSLNMAIHAVTTCHLKLLVHLNYPQISQQTDVKGLQPSLRSLGKYKLSEFIGKPKYEHKVLKLNLLDEHEPMNQSGESKESKAFHAVRKHIRRYKTGKVTFVKAHFRGDKRKGITVKDYELHSKKG